MRTLAYYIVLILAAGFITMFFISQNSRHVQIGYELQQLRHDRDALRDEGRKLDFDISRAASHEALVGAAKQLGLALQPPSSSRLPR